MLCRLESGLAPFGFFLVGGGGALMLCVAKIRIVCVYGRLCYMQVCVHAHEGGAAQPGVSVTSPPP